MTSTPALILPMSISLVAGNAAAADGAAILLVREQAAVAGCRHLEQIQSKSMWGGFAATGLAYNRAMSSLKGKAAALGATHILIVDISNTVGGTNMIGDAYSCPKLETPTPAVAPSPAAPG
jgi:hypothetical protein